MQTFTDLMILHLMLHDIRACKYNTLVRKASSDRLLFYIQLIRSNGR